MKPHSITIFFILSFTLQSTITEANEKNRRILHQPLFPSPPLPPPTAVPDSPEQDQPFFHELPDRPTPPVSTAVPVANSVAAHSSNPRKKLAIAISSGILTVAMLSALAVYLYKYRRRSSGDSQKLVGGESVNHDSTMAPSNFLYIGTVEPSSRSLARDTNTANGSPYRKLNSGGKRSDRYRPSPELQPLPPLTKPPPPPVINSPPPMTSSDDESHDSNFYTPQGSSMSYESPSSRHRYLNNVISQVNQTKTTGFNHHSKRTSRLSASSPDTRHVIIPSIKQSLPPAPPPPPPLLYTPIRAKFSALPPPPDIARLRSISGDESKIPIPPPPPPQLSIPRYFGAVETHTPIPVSKQKIMPQSPKATPQTQKASAVEDVNGDEKNGSKPKLKPLHWDKVRATSDRATVWDQLKSSSFQLNEDAMESLFRCSSANSVPKEASMKSVMSSFEHENRVLDPKKSQNIAILLRALNVTREEVSEALLDGNLEGLGPELLETLVKMAPTKEEEIKLRDYNGESSKLGSAERFLKAILDIPFAFKRVEAMLYRANFDTEVKYLRKSFQILEDASEELKNSRLFLKLLEAVLRTGNRMNDGTNRGDARAFKLDTLLKLVDVKGTDGKTTLLHFVVQEIIRSSEPDSDPTSENQPEKTNFEFKQKQGLQVMSDLSKELDNVKKAAGMDSDVLSSYVSKLETGLEKIRLVMKYEKQSMQGKFFDSMKEFFNRAIEEIYRVKAEERKALSMVKEVTEYFHGDAAKEEAHPLRIFMIVRDFLSVLDNVCRDVGKMQEKATMGAGRSFRMPVTASLPVLNRYNVNRSKGYDDDDDDNM